MLNPQIINPLGLWQRLQLKVYFVCDKGSSLKYTLFATKALAYSATKLVTKKSLKYTLFVTNALAYSATE